MLGVSTQCKKSSSKLREALIEVFERLSWGETLRQDDFKSQVNERSSLFVGYRQQDSHEFLTTLLDLIDEDYKKTEEEEEDRAMADAPVSPEEEEPTCQEGQQAGSHQEQQAAQALHHHEDNNKSSLKK